MRTGTEFTVSNHDHRRFASNISDRDAAQKHVWRARIVLLTTDGLGTNAIMNATSKSKTCVWRWQERFVNEGVDGLLLDKTRPPGTPLVLRERVDDVACLTLNRRHNSVRIGRYCAD